MAHKREKEIFSLVDANNFYVSCERSFAPKLEDKPVVVLSNNDGCVIARSNEAKKLGIPMGAPLFQVAGLVRQHHIEVYSSNYSLYADMSNRVMNVLAQFTPELEIYSIDEAFLSLAGMAPDGEFTPYTRRIRDTVHRYTGIPTSIGIAHTKTLAKVAGERAKKDPSLDGVFDLTAYREPHLDQLLSEFEVEDIWGIGHRRGRLLRQHGIENAFHLKHADDHWLLKHLTITGLRTAWELRGISCLPLELAPPPKKAICCAKSFGRPVTELNELKEALAAYTSRVAEKLRAQSSQAAVLQVFLRTNHFNPAEPVYSNSATARLPLATSYTPALISQAHACLEKIYRPGYRYRKVGLLVTGLTPAHQTQLNLFQPHPEETATRQQNLMQALDTINRRYGRNTLRLASVGISQDWKMRQANVSPHFTTQWQDLPLARA